MTQAGLTSDPAALGHRPVPQAEAKAEFLLRLRAKGVRDLQVLRALEMVPRETFVPHRYADLANRDVALPIPCGQTMSEPFIVARMLEVLVLTPENRVLEIGSGSGYVTAILARLAGGVVGIERYRSLVAQARTRLEGLEITHAEVMWGDAFAVPANVGTFDRLLVHASVDALPASLLERLSQDAIMVYARSGGAGPTARQRLFRAARSAKGDWIETPICACRLRALEPGLSREL